MRKVGFFCLSAGITGLILATVVMQHSSVKHEDPFDRKGLERLIVQALDDKNQR